MHFGSRKGFRIISLANFVQQNCRSTECCTTSTSFENPASQDTRPKSLNFNRGFFMRVEFHRCRDAGSNNSGVSRLRQVCNNFYSCLWRLFGQTARRSDLFRGVRRLWWEINYRVVDVGGESVLRMTALRQMWMAILLAAEKLTKC